jgi:hypothetical protein
MSEDVHRSDDYTPLCHVCGKPMRLIDVRAKAAALGYRIPGDDEQYVIQCCGYTLTIEDPDQYQTAIRNLKQYRGAEGS